MRRASDLWNEGEKALAHIHLTYADLPIYGEDEMLRLFLAEECFSAGITPAELMNAQGRARRERTRKWPLERAAHLVTAGVSWAQIRNLIQVLVQAWRRFHLEGKAPGKTTAKPESEPIPSLDSRITRG